MLRPISNMQFAQHHGRSILRDYHAKKVELAARGIKGRMKAFFVRWFNRSMFWGLAAFTLAGGFAAADNISQLVAH